LEEKVDNINKVIHMLLVILGKMADKNINYLIFSDKNGK